MSPTISVPFYKDNPVIVEVNDGDWTRMIAKIVEKGLESIQERH